MAEGLPHPVLSGCGDKNGPVAFGRPANNEHLWRGLLIGVANPVVPPSMKVTCGFTANVPIWVVREFNDAVRREFHDRIDLAHIGASL